MALLGISIYSTPESPKLPVNLNQKESPRKPFGFVPVPLLPRSQLFATASGKSELSRFDCKSTATMGKKEGSSLCYVKDPDFAWVPATLEKTEGNKAHVSIPQYKDEQSITSDGGRNSTGEVKKVIDLKDYKHGVLPLQNVDKNGVLTEHADMVKLPYLHEVRWVWGFRTQYSLFLLSSP